MSHRPNLLTLHPVDTDTAPEPQPAPTGPTLKAVSPAPPVTTPSSPEKLTARERLEVLFDPGTFVEIDSAVTHHHVGFGLEKKHPAGDGVLTGFGTIHGRTVYVYSQDFSVMGGSVGRAHALKIVKIMDLAAKAGAPIVGLNDSGGARIQEGILSLAGYGSIFLRNTRLSGVVPQISVILGPCAGGAVYSPSVTDFVVMSRQASMFVTGPRVVKVATHEDVTSEQLGGGEVHARTTGVCHHLADNDREALAWVRLLLTYLPDNNLSEPHPVSTSQHPVGGASLRSLVPSDTRKGYDVRRVIEAVVDAESFLETQERFALNVVTGFARIAGQVVGVVANQPEVLAGCLDIDASRKAARFVRFCNAFNLPLLTLVDVPGFLPGSSQEHEGIITHGAKLLYAFAEATVPKVSLILRKAYGGAYIVMSSKEIGGDYCLAWPDAEIAVMGARGAVEILFRRELEGLTPEDELYRQREAEFQAEFANPRVAAEHGLIDMIVEPEATRETLVRLFASVRHKREETPLKRNGNIPL